MESEIRTLSADVDLDTEDRRLRRDGRTRRVHSKIFILTVPGILRLLEILFSAVHIGCFCFYGTYYYKIVNVAVTPIFVVSSRELFFVLVNYHTFLTSLTFVMASLVSTKSQEELHGTLYVFFFDFIQFVLIIAAAAGIILLYTGDEVKDAYSNSLPTRQGLSVTGVLLGCLHLIGSVYGLSIFVRKSELFPEE